MKVTHGFGVKSNDGVVDRQIDFCLGDDNHYYITITTTWPDKQEPTTTRLKFSHVGLSLLAEGSHSALHHMHEYPCSTWKEDEE